MKEWINQLDKLHILVIGDLIIDKYIYGTVERISPEAPIPIVNQKKLDHRPGGAANVALNLHEMGIECSVLTVIGADEMGDLASGMIPFILNESNAFIRDSDRVTTCKTRVMANLHHIVRIDHENQNPVSAMITKTLIDRIQDIHQKRKVDIVILQDYEKGIFHPGNIPLILNTLNKLNIPVIVDPKDKNFWYYKDVALFKPNKSELEKALGYKFENTEAGLKEVDDKLRSKINNHISAITLSDAGIYLSNSKVSVWDKPAKREIVDVCGAGDAVISILGAMLGTQCGLDEMARVSNIAGGLVCEISGVSPIPFQRLLQELN